MPLNNKCLIKGTYLPPGDKSISHRILILTGQVVGKSKIKSFPIMSMFDYIVYSLFYRIKQFRILYYLEYNEKEVNYIGKRILSELPSDLHEELLNKDAGETLNIREIGDNINLILICDRKDDIGIQVSRESIEENIYSQKIGMMSRRYLRDLRRDAVIEYR